MNTFRAALLASLFALPASASEQDTGDPFGGLFGGETAAEPEGEIFGDSRDVVGTSFESMRESAPPDAMVPVAVVLDIKPSWHIWTNEGAELEGTADFDSAIWTAVSVSSEDGLKIVDIQWPKPHRVSADLGMGPEDYAVFEGRSVIFVTLGVPRNADAGDRLTATLSVEFQACDDSTCLAPTFDPPTKTLTLQIDDAAPAKVEATGLFADWTAPVSLGSRGSRGGSRGADTPDSSIPEETPVSGSIDTTTTTDVDDDTALESATTGSTFFGVSIPKSDGTLGLVILILMSVVGGFVLNLTPCVLPVIPIKIMTISQHANTPGRALSLGLWMALGVFGFWLLIGLPVAFLTTFTDPSVIFGIWWVTLGIGLLIGLMGIGIMGLFSVQLPQSVYMVNPKADNAGGSFLFGVMTAVLGLPCFGFVAGALLAGTATLPAWITLVIFGSIGAGMALPYLVLSAKPALVEKIPRTGPASELVKQVMGLLLLAAAAYFIGSGLIGLTAEQPWMAKQIHWWAIAFALCITGLWLTIRTFQITKSAGARVFWTVVAILFAVIPTWFAIQSTEKAHATWEELADLRDGGSTSYSTKVWNPYTPARLEAARADGKTVVLDFTAEWCLNCKALKAAVLDVDPVKSRLADDPDVVTFTADNTSRTAPGWALMKELGQTGIPLLAIWGPDDPENAPWQSNAYTPTQVLDAIQARESGD